MVNHAARREKAGARRSPMLASVAPTPVAPPSVSTHTVGHPGGSTAQVQRHPRLRSATTSIVVAGVIYAITWLVMPGDGLSINGNGCKLVQAEGLARNDWLDVSVPGPGRAIDPDLAYQPLGDPFGKVIGGRLFVSFPIPFAFLSSLPYSLFGTGGLTLIPFFSGLLLLAAVAALARLVHTDAFGVWVAVVGVALGTPVWF